MAIRLQTPLSTAIESGDMHSWQPTRALYASLLKARPGRHALEEARDYLSTQLRQVVTLPCDLPADPEHLGEWARRRYQHVGEQFTDYLRQRREGAPRRYFSGRAQALYFLRGVAPTKMVDGAWLHGLVHRWYDTRLRGLIQTYLEELGDGRALANHVLLYRALLAENGCEHWQDQPDTGYRQGAIQLALGWNAPDLLPEIIGFNLGYEQLPLHLPITVYELEELGFDPHYFRLHVTVDNPSTGHARRAIDAVNDAWPALDDGRDFYQRIRNGYRLNSLGEGTEAVIAGFDAEREVLRVFREKGEFGRHAHSDHCRIGGRTINDWLSHPDHTAAFIRALKTSGWVEHDTDPRRSRFWQLIEGEQAMMAGVFSPYEKQVIRDWITQGGSCLASPRVASRLRRRQRRRSREDAATPPWHSSPGSHRGTDDELRLLQHRLAESPTRESAMHLLAKMLGPATHASPVGLMATRIYRRLLLSAGQAPLPEPAGISGG
jgi:hypothetical protein